ncbi:YjdF family protein [Terribacillus sp. 179-K 1B1 HS]|uniref:YjdF family protein n=1 Tax=Terribacillus sp. 179-K 1B1 HS TaxID=3142388 RepID=UPI0039A31212
MKLTIYFDGQFYAGLVEIETSGRYYAYRHLFGKEPKSEEVLYFVKHELLGLIENKSGSGIQSKEEKQRPISPKRLQRLAAKESQKTSLSTKAELALKQSYEEKKKMKQINKREFMEQQKAHKRQLKVMKRKAKHKGR